jgi:hypothetical protein
MTLQRKNPLPVGRYSFEPIGKTVAPFEDWLAQHRATVRVISNQVEEIPVDATAIFSDTQKLGHFLFDVLAPTDWPAKVLGFPEIEKADETKLPDNTPADPDAEEESKGPSGFGLLVLFGIAYLVFGKKGF